MGAWEVLLMATETTTKKSWVQKTPGVCGGRACIRNSRITVWGLVNSRRLGATDDQILQNIVGLMPADIQVAWDYYRTHPAEIDEDIRENEED
jgi:type III restriction enzyme